MFKVLESKREENSNFYILKPFWTDIRNTGISGKHAFPIKKWHQSVLISFIHSVMGFCDKYEQQMMLTQGSVFH
jgi:hypothetical protein